MHALTPPAMTSIDAADIADVIDAGRPEPLRAVRSAHLAHDAGHSSRPHGSFPRVPDRDRDRVISLPACLGGEFEVTGNKWVTSFPDNTRHGIPRADAFFTGVGV